MLYLAQVQIHPTSGERKLFLLAYQQADDLWQLSTPKTLSDQESEDIDIAVGVLVLVELDNHQQIIKIENAKDWVIELLKKFLISPPLTPEWIEKEKERIEQGRQEITTKSLDLTRRQLELETQREQLQELETQLKKEQAKLEKRQHELDALEAKLNPES